MDRLYLESNEIKSIFESSSDWIGQHNKENKVFGNMCRWTSNRKEKKNESERNIQINGNIIDSFEFSVAIRMPLYNVEIKRRTDKYLNLFNDQIGGKTIHWHFVSGFFGELQRRINRITQNNRELRN